MEELELPPLPEPLGVEKMFSLMHSPIGTRSSGQFTEAQMRSYAMQAVLADRERISSPQNLHFEKIVEIAGKHDTEKLAGLTAFARECIAAAIRKGTT